ncbi:MAG: penicillin-binding transpeptidase domain-containing protein [Lentisphaerota bacterium]
MKSTVILYIAAVALSGCVQTAVIPDTVVGNAFADRRYAIVIIDCSSGTISDFRPLASSEKLPPCSTFKIWNALIGLDSGIITSGDEAFYRWDGETRAIPDWNRDLTVKEAFRASCVPAFQGLARKIGSLEMQSWLDKIGYGDRDISAGINVFWLPAKGRKTILISPKEQAQLMCKLVSGKIPCREQSLAVLKDMMVIRTTDRGVLYGKTGSGVDGTGTYVLGWFVGYVESRGMAYAFACALHGDNVMGKDALAIVEIILKKQELL